MWVSKRQPKSLSAATTCIEEKSKLGGLIPGTPPSGRFGSGPTSQMSVLPLPRSLVASICRSGGVLLSPFDVIPPGGLPLLPGRTSTIKKKPEPPGRM